jgi:LmbE family N-acetylglucosaminyl deacetylase
MNSLKFTRVLALSPHTDDVELGAGGTLSRLSREAAKITVIAFSAPENVLRAEFEASTKVLMPDSVEIFDFETRKFPSERQNILQLLYDYGQQHEPDVVLTPTTYDKHQDHQVVTAEAIRAFQNSTILGYELPWNNTQFDRNFFIELNDSDVKMKLEMLSKYESQVEKRNYFKENYIYGLLQTRGVQIKSQYAEGFEVIRQIANL